jgi:5-methylcytosine-specific restriction enzyme subunit McrC
MNCKGIWIKNIWYMLAYVYDDIELDREVNVSAESFDDVLNLFAGVLSKGVARLLKRGLHRDYVDCEEEQTVIRGRIAMPGTIRNAAMGRKQVSCITSEYTEDNLLNQIIKTTSKVLIRSDEVDSRWRNAIKEQMWYFTGVSDLEVSSIPWERIHFGREVRSYRLIIAVCRLILENMLQTEEDGQVHLRSFPEDVRLESLYERFLRAYYKREHGDTVKVGAEEVNWALDDGREEDDYSFLPHMVTDVFLEDKRSHRVLIIDAKFYGRVLLTHYANSIARSAHLYQIFAYVKNEQQHRVQDVSGMLLYAQTEEGSIDETYSMSGNAIRVKTLDLNQDFAGIRTQLDTILNEWMSGTEESVVGMRQKIQAFEQADSF